jgi:cell wall assembly regulator SMI1
MWHSLTSYDRRKFYFPSSSLLILSKSLILKIPDSDYDSPYRTGQHVPLSQSRHAPLTSVATTASESRAELTSPYLEDSGRASTSALNGSAYPTSPTHPLGSGRNSPAPYSPGKRSSSLKQQTTVENFENTSPGEIPLQPFQEGLPPSPPVSHSWRRIDKWASENYEELFDALGEGCTNNDLNELEHQLDCSLPLEVRESLQIHDGQEQGGRPTGIIFGSMLLDCEEIVHEWENWKVVNQEYLTEPINYKPATPVMALGGSSSSSSKPARPSRNPNWRRDLLARQDSQPPNAIQKVYAHPGWIPLVRDWGGNNLAVDLAPGPTGTWGQVILFGRDYDCKYVVARSWTALLATVADDMNSGKWFVDEETNELKLRINSGKVEPGYLDILRWRADQKYGRREVKRRSMASPINGNLKANGSPTGSPYASPAAETGEPRGRSMQRFSGASPVASPNRPSYAKSSPLARVNEEAPTPIKVHTSDFANRKLIEIGTPRPSEDGKGTKVLETLLEPITPDDHKEDSKLVDFPSKDLGLANGGANKRATVEDDIGMKTIDI